MRRGSSGDAGDWAYDVIIPSRADEPFLTEALESSFQQSQPPQSVFLVLNGPNALTCDSYADVGHRFPAVVRVTMSEAGMVSAINQGLTLVKIPSVAFLDADDMWAPRKQELQMHAFGLQPEVDAVFCEAVNTRIDADGNFHDGVQVATRLLSATCFRADAFERFGKLDPVSTHFTWLVRWWTHAVASGTQTGSVDDRGLLRRVHSGDTWVAQRELGQAELFSELRRIAAIRNETEPEQSGT